MCASGVWLEETERQRGGSQNQLQFFCTLKFLVEPLLFEARAAKLQLRRYAGLRPYRWPCYYRPAKASRSPASATAGMCTSHDFFPTADPSPKEAIPSDCHLESFTYTETPTHVCSHSLDRPPSPLQHSTPRRRLSPETAYRLTMAALAAYRNLFRAARITFQGTHGASPMRPTPAIHQVLSV